MDSAEPALDYVEHVFDYYLVSRVRAAASVQELQARVQRMQGAAVARELPMLPVWHGVVSLRTGMSCSVDTPQLATALLAGPSNAGEWVAVVGAPDLGLEAAAALGVTLERTILVPDPGEHWLSVTATLVDIASVVLVQPPSNGVTDAQAARLSSRLRQTDAALIAWGDWPRASVRLSAASSRWTGVGQGTGHLSGCELRVTVQAGGLPARQVTIALDAGGQELTMWSPVGSGLRGDGWGRDGYHSHDRQLVQVG